MSGPPRRADPGSDADPGPGADPGPDADLALDPDAAVIPVARRSLRARAILAVVAIIVVVAFALRPLVIAPQPAQPSVRPSPGQGVAAGDRIAMVSSDGTLAIVDRTGSLVTRLPLDATVFRFPAFSPDGSALAAIGATAISSSVVVFDVPADAPIGATDEPGATADPSASAEPGATDEPGATAEPGPTDEPGATAASTRSPRTLYASPDRGVIYLSWAPDSQRIAFLTGAPDGLALRVGRADASEDDRVVVEAQPLYWDWIDASHLVVHGGGAGAGGFVGDVGLDGAAPVERASLPGIFQSPAISADGRYLAYVADRPGATSTLVIAERDGPARSALAELRAAAFGWSPARAELGFIDGGGAAGPSLGPLRVGDAASGVARTLIDAAVAAFFWAPDGASIAALVIEPADGGNIASAARASDGSVAAIPGFHVRLVVVDAATGEQRLERIVALSELFEQQFLPFFDQYAKSHAIWSADSRDIVLPLVDAEGDAHLTVIPIDGGPEVDLGPGILGFWSP